MIRDRDDAAVAPDLHVGGVDPQVGPVALDRAIEECPHALVDLLAEPAHLALRDAPHAERLDEVVDGAGRDALDVGLLYDSGECLLGEPSRLQEAREVRALAQLRNAQLDRPGAGLPGALPIAIALRQTLCALLAVAGSGQAGHLHLHQALGRKADHLPQQVGVGDLLYERA